MSSRTHYIRSALVLCAVLLTACTATKQPVVEQQPPAQQTAEPQAREHQATAQRTAEQQATEQQTAGQQPVEQPAGEQQAAVMAPEAEAYLDELLELMQGHSINRLTIDWDDFRAQVFAKAAGAKSIGDTRPAISEALRLLGDRHSSYQPKVGSMISWSSCTSVPGRAAPWSVEVPSTVGYIRVTGFIGTNTMAAAFSDSILQKVKSADGQGATGWIVDLRGNTGGNMWPMLTGLSPILGEGTVGYFMNPTGQKVGWELRDGVAYMEGQTPDQNKAAYRIQNGSPRVAVLTDGRTASSGEAVAIAFKGRPATRFFGTPTCGLSTANHTFHLSDGATLALTGSLMADRTGKPYGGPIAPDEVIEDPATVAERAIEWLKTGH